MLKRFLIKYVKVWWAGFKVLCWWSAFWIVITILCFPVMALTELVENYVVYIIGFVFSIFVVPIIFYLTAKYLLLFGDQEQRVVKSDEDSTGVAGKWCSGIESAVQFIKPTTFYIVLLIFSLVAAIITPPDVVTQIFVIAEMVIIYALLVFIISRFKSFAQTPSTIQKMTVVLVCLLSITISSSVTFFQYYYRARAERSEQVTSAAPSKTEAAGSTADTNIPANATDTMGGEK